MDVERAMARGFKRRGRQQLAVRRDHHRVGARFAQPAQERLVTQRLGLQDLQSPRDGKALHG
jgi:hypothetical protein